MLSERFKLLCDFFEKGLGRKLSGKEMEFIAWIVKRESDFKNVPN